MHVCGVELAILTLAIGAWASYGRAWLWALRRALGRGRGADKREGRARW